MNELPRAIEIQTASYCNAGCVICPHPDVERMLPRGSMDDALFASICSQLEGIPRIIPYLNNEPFLDPRYIDRLRMVRRMHPQAIIEVSTNISPLTDAKVAALRDIRVDDLRMSVFGFSEGTYERIMPGLKWNKTKPRVDAIVADDALRETIGTLSLTIIEHPWVPEEEYLAAQEYCENHGIKLNRWGFLDRSGSVRAFSNNVRKERTSGCEQERPYERMHVTVDGKVVLCCQDWKHTVVLGDLTTTPLREVWMSEAYERIRREVYDPAMPSPEICKRCKLAR